MRPSTRRSDDADVIRARLRALLAESQRSGGWVPGDRDDEPHHPGLPDDGRDATEPDEDPDGADRWETELPGGRSLPEMGRHRAPGRTARVVPDRPAAWALWLAGLAAAALVLGWTWLHRPEVEPAPSTAPTPSVAAAARSTGAPAAGSTAPTAASVVVSVVGQVVHPGLVTLAPGARVADALAAAGGLLPEADPAAVNAAAVLTDGQQIAVGVPGAAPAAGTAAAGAAPAGPVDLNTATVADLDALPGVGPVLAQRIVDHRTEHGPFTSVEQLDDVSGIGPALYARLAPKVRV